MMRYWPLVAGFVLGCATAFASPVQAAPAMTATQESPTRVMVMLDLPANHFRSGSSYGGSYGDDAGRQMRRRFARRIAEAHRLTVLEDWPMERIGVDCVIMQISDGRSPAEVARELGKVRGVAWSQPLNEFEMQGDPQPAPRANAPRYNDRLLATQPANLRWHLASLHTVATGRGVTIGIIDSRIDTAHPDLAGQIAGSSDFTGGMPQAERHGTGVAGIIAARPNNTVGIVGVAPGARVLGLRACWERPQGGATVCDSLSLAKAMVFALDHKVDVINLSLSGPPDPLLARLIAVAVRQGVTVVAAINQRQSGISFPADLPGVVAVASEALPARSAPVYIAPGVDVPTTEPEGRWGFVSGSSFAAAHVSGLAALLRQAHGAHGFSASLLGPGGPIDACALVARQSVLDQSRCLASR